MSPWIVSAAALAVSGLALWQRSTAGWVVAAIANGAAAWFLWVG